jgi:large conductance mechanosensitive channel
MAFWKEFKEFSVKGNVIDLAVAVVIGGAFGKIVSAIVADIIMPLVGAVMPAGDWRAWTVTSLNLKLGDVLGAVIDFIVIALVLFLFVNKLMKALKKPAPPGEATTKECPECLETIPLKARRCKACTSVQPA